MHNIHMHVHTIHMQYATYSGHIDTLIYTCVYTIGTHKHRYSTIPEHIYTQH